MEGHKGFLRIVNWRPLQRYQKPNPPWIKLYTSLLSDDGEDAQWNARDRWRSLGARGQALLTNLWLYAAYSTVDGRLWGDPEYLAQVLPYEGPIDLGPLLAAGFVAWESNEKTETEREREGETETEEEKESQAPSDAAQRSEAEEREREIQSGKGGSARSSRPAPTRSGASTKPEPKSEKRAEPQREADQSTRESQSQRASGGQARTQSTRESQSERASGAQARSQSTGVATPCRVIGNPSPPSGVRLDPPESDGKGRPSPGPQTPTGGLPGPPAAAGGPPAARAGPALRRGGESSLLGRSLPQALLAASDPVKYAWIADVFSRLRFPFAMDSPFGRQEIGSFASVYDQLRDSGLSYGDQMEILAHDLDDADRIVRKKKARKRGAVLCAIHNSRVATYLARAGPSK